MEADQTLIRELNKVEGDELTPYRDTNGYWTIGIGHLITKDELSSGKIYINGTPVRWRNGITQAQCDALLMQDIGWAESAVNALVKVPLTQDRFDALVSFTFNVGAEALRTSTLLLDLNEGHYSQVPMQMKRWVRKADGSICEGLVNRRRIEAALWNGNPDGSISSC